MQKVDKICKCIAAETGERQHYFALTAVKQLEIDDDLRAVVDPVAAGFCEMIGVYASISAIDTGSIDSSIINTSSIDSSIDVSIDAEQLRWRIQIPPAGVASC